MPSRTATGVIPAAPWRVKALSVQPGYRLAVTCQDGTSSIADLSSILTAKACGIFTALAEQQLFELAYLELGVVTWPKS